MINNSKRNRIINIIVTMIVIFSLLYSFVPLLLLKENYVFTVWDNLDSTAGLTQYIFNSKSFFNLNNRINLLNGLYIKESTQTYYLYDFLNCNIGFIKSQILIRTIGTFIGFFGLRRLLIYLFKNNDNFDMNIVNLVSAAYAITPCAYNRILSFAFLPNAILFFLLLKERKKISPLLLITLIFPLFFQFSAFLVFVCGFWFLFTIIDFVKNKKINVNLTISFIILLVSTLVFDYSYFYIALFAENTNRNAIVGNRTFTINYGVFEKFVEYLLYGQGHAYDLHFNYLLPFCIVGTLYCFVSKKENNKSIILIIGWILWLLSALVEILYENGLKTGLLIIDGFNWGRVIYIMRIIWYLMFIYISFFDNNKYIKITSYIIIIFQLILVGTTDTTYNDTKTSLISNIFGFQNSETVTFNEFFAEDLFNEIKEDIEYEGEKVVAYGYHPSVLQYNGFNTLDGYLSVHSNDYQKSFRKIIEPALEKYEKYRNYYDGWGGRSYIFGELDYDPTRIKDVDPVPLYINVDEYKKMNGKYIISRAKIKNSDELKITLVGEYTNEDSIYHFYVYSV